MKTLKLLVAAVLLGGCVTPREDGVPIDQTRVYRITRLVVYHGTLQVLRRLPEQRPILERTRAGLYTLVSQERWDVAAVATALVQAGVTEAQSPEAELVLAGSTVLLDVFVGAPVDLSRNRTAEAYVRGTEAGVRHALAEPAARARSLGETETGRQLRVEAEATRPPRR